MTYVRKALVDTITVWEAEDVDSTGETMFSSHSPYTIEGRWQERSDVFVNKEGEEQVSRVVIFLDVDIPIGSWFYKGTSVADDPHSVQGAFESQRVAKVASIAGTLIERKVYL